MALENMKIFEMSQSELDNIVQSVQNMQKNQSAATNTLLEKMKQEIIRLRRENEELKRKLNLDGGFKIGDEVVCIDADEIYDAYSSWPGLRGFESHFVVDKNPTYGHTYIIRNIADHGHGGGTIMLIQDPDTTQVFIVTPNAIEKKKEEKK